MRRWIPFLLLFIVLAGTTLLYLPTLKYEAIWDTRDFLRQSVLLTQDRPLSDAFTGGYIYGQIGVAGQSIYYRPLVNLSFMLEKRLWGLSPRTLRRTNLVLFLILLLLVYGLMRAWNLAWPAALTAMALFAASPINTGNVVWVVGRGDLMMLLWGLLAAIFLRRRKQWGAWVIPAAWTAFALAVLSKETALFFIPLFFLADPPGLKWKQRLHHLAFTGIGAAFLAVKHLWLGIGSPALLHSATLLDYPLRGLAALGHYAGILILPFRFPLFHFVSEVENPLHIIAGTLAALALAAAIIRAFRSRANPTLRFPLVLVGIFLIPFILLSFTSMWPFRLSSRYMMTASVGLFWLTALGLEHLSRRVRPLVVFTLILLFFPATLSLNHAHRDELTYWSRALEDHPGQPILILKLAETHYMRKNDLVAYSLLQRIHGVRGRRLTEMHRKILLAKLESGRFRYPAALHLLDDAGPLPAAVYFQAELLRARIDASCGDAAQAVTRLQELIRGFPRRPEPHALLHRLLTGREQWEKASRAEAAARRILGTRITWNTFSMRDKFTHFNPLEKMNFFIQHLNFSGARKSLLASGQPETREDRLLLAWIDFQAGREATATEQVQRIATLFPSPADCARIGQFYLDHLRRPETARIWYRRALDARDDPQWHRTAQYIETLLSPKAGIDN